LNESLDQTGSFRRRSTDEVDGSSLQVDRNRVNLPQWLFAYLIAQLVGGIWWAATLQSDVRYLQQENLKAWQKIETHELQLQQLDRLVRTAVKEALQDSGYVKIPSRRREEERNE